MPGTMPDPTQQLDSFLANHPDIEVFELILPDINGQLRGKWLPRSNIAKVFQGGVKLPLSTLAFDIWGRDPEAWVFESGDADGICEPDIKTLAPVPWLKRPTGQLFLSMKEVSGEPCTYDPRAILKRLMARFNDLGLTPVLASEMEFYLFQNGTDPLGRPIHTQSGINGGAATGGQTYGIEAMQDMSELMHAIRDACEAQNLPVDTLITEAAPSQYEINLYHQPDALLAADQAIMLQRTIQGVAKQQDLRASFMAKPFADLAGNGMHVHCSLLDKENTDSSNNNAFNNSTDEGSELLRFAIAGCLQSMKDCMLLLAPHLNSYRRFQRGSHAPMAPTWGYENRTVSVRVPADNHKAMRIEHRVAGADANPYLVMSAILAGMLYGIENKLSAPDPVIGDAYDQHPPSLPRYWPDALTCFSESDFIREYFGADFQRIFALTKQQEIDEFDGRITPLEYEAYL